MDLINNNFNDKYGNMILGINNDYTKGLITINLHGNKLGEKSTDKICYALCSDQYLRAVDNRSPNNIVFQEFQEF